MRRGAHNGVNRVGISCPGGDVHSHSWVSDTGMNDGHIGCCLRPFARPICLNVSLTGCLAADYIVVL